VLALTAFVEAQRPREFPPIVVGDFNAPPESDEIRFMTGLATLDGRSVFFQDAWDIAGDGASDGITWSNRNTFAALENEPERRIDYVFVGWRREGGAGVVRRASVVCDVPVHGVYPSDHFGVLAEVALG
jgi:endonuclease/exonuclease/phosphatase family metal-dependent hydrolase